MFRQTHNDKQLRPPLHLLNNESSTSLEGMEKPMPALSPSPVSATNANMNTNASRNTTPSPSQRRAHIVEQYKPLPPVPQAGDTAMKVSTPQLEPVSPPVAARSSSIYSRPVSSWEMPASWACPDDAATDAYNGHNDHDSPTCSGLGAAPHTQPAPPQGPPQRTSYKSAFVLPPYTYGSATPAAAQQPRNRKAEKPELELRTFSPLLPEPSRTPTPVDEGEAWPAWPAGPAGVAPVRGATGDDHESRRPPASYETPPDTPTIAATPPGAEAWAPSKQAQGRCSVPVVTPPSPPSTTAQHVAFAPTTWDTTPLPPCRDGDGGGSGQASRPVAPSTGAGRKRSVDKAEKALAALGLVDPTDPFAGLEAESKVRPGHAPPRTRDYAHYIQAGRRYGGGSLTASSSGAAAASSASPSPSPHQRHGYHRGPRTPGAPKHGEHEWEDVDEGEEADERGEAFGSRAEYHRLLIEQYRELSRPSEGTRPKGRQHHRHHPFNRDGGGLAGFAGGRPGHAHNDARLVPRPLFWPRRRNSGARRHRSASSGRHSRLSSLPLKMMLPAQYAAELEARRGSGNERASDASGGKAVVVQQERQPCGEAGEVRDELVVLRQLRQRKRGSSLSTAPRTPPFALEGLLADRTTGSASASAEAEASAASLEVAACENREGDTQGSSPTAAGPTTDATPKSPPTPSPSGPSSGSSPTCSTADTTTTPTASTRAPPQPPASSTTGTRPRANKIDASAPPIFHVYPSEQIRQQQARARKAARRISPTDRFSTFYPRAAAAAAGSAESQPQQQKKKKKEKEKKKERFAGAPLGGAGRDGRATGDAAALPLPPLPLELPAAVRLAPRTRGQEAPPARHQPRRQERRPSRAAPGAADAGGASPLPPPSSSGSDDGGGGGGGGGGMGQGFASSGHARVGSAGRALLGAVRGMLAPGSPQGGGAGGAGGAAGKRLPFTHERAASEGSAYGRGGGASRAAGLGLSVEGGGSGPSEGRRSGSGSSWWRRGSGGDQGGMPVAETEAREGAGETAEWPRGSRLLVPAVLEKALESRKELARERRRGELKRSIKVVGETDPRNVVTKEERAM
ncbi:hypothetical protein BDY21DRAFT_369934 [Lineolata rhizophorae]|uniref:Uncharacterized protein n=1 Tax=Lineolata rhizophorae TaxID=578093 RepID=A0A6A6P867_9PEZI|nr:hypothetical protein BDY21DRAFT_369934 [Lineolata rhizophorae]